MDILQVRDTYQKDAKSEFKKEGPRGCEINNSPKEEARLSSARPYFADLFCGRIAMMMPAKMKITRMAQSMPVTGKTYNMAAQTDIIILQEYEIPTPTLKYGQESTTLRSYNYKHPIQGTVQYLGVHVQWI